MTEADARIEAVSEEMLRRSDEQCGRILEKAALERVLCGAAIFLGASIQRSTAAAKRISRSARTMPRRLRFRYSPATASMGRKGQSLQQAFPERRSASSLVE